MANFQPCFERTMNFEGRILENVPNDPGGMTFWGISRRYNPTWPGWAVIDKLGPHDNTLPTLVANLYQSLYWDKNLLGQLNSQQLASQVFDAVVNLGSNAVVKSLQNMIGAVVDGNMGPHTVGTCNSMDENTLVESFLEWRKSYYQNLVAINPAKAEFLADWLSRCVIS
jgi:lysozyme family protein